MTLRADAPGGSLSARAVLFGERLDLHGLAPAVDEPGSPAEWPARDGVSIFLFRWGAAVIFGATPEEQAALAPALADRIVNPVEAPAEETARVVTGAQEDAAASGGRISLRDVAAFRLAVVAETLAKSAALTHQEALLSGTLDRLDPVIDRLRRRGTLAASSRSLLSAVGYAVWARNHALARVQAADKPEALWTHPELERLNALLAEEFELVDRAAALDRKLSLIGDTVQTMLALVEGRRSLLLEIAVVVLIAIELGSGLYQLFAG